MLDTSKKYLFKDPRVNVILSPLVVFLLCETRSVEGGGVEV